MPTMPTQPDTSLLTAALAGYQQQLAHIDAQIASIQKMLKGRASSDGGGGDMPGPFKPTRRSMSPAARKRIAAAQRKRWAAYRRAK
jgi:hypothetical protein